MVASAAFVARLAHGRCGFGTARQLMAAKAWESRSSSYSATRVPSAECRGEPTAPRGEESRLRQDRQPVRVDVLVSVAGAVRRRSRRRVEIARRDVAVVCPGDVDQMVRAGPVGVELDVVTVERGRTSAEGEAVAVVRDIGDLRLVRERRPADAGAVRAGVEDIG